MSDSVVPLLIDGRYEVLTQIGTGGMGTVYRVRDRTSGAEVALKMMGPGDDVSPTAQHRFKREFRALSRLSHPNIVRVYEYGSHEKSLYYTMDYIEGRSLKEFADQDRPLSRTGPIAFQTYLKRVTDYVGQALEALDHVHRSGIVHRDLKPTNVLVGPQGQVRIMDFGLASDLEASVTITKVGTLMGTVAYMSPEQAQGRRIDHRSDLYSIGVILYELATGERPFSHANPVTLVRKHIVERPLPPSRLVAEIPEWLEAIILKLLEKDPVDRFQTAGEVLAALKEPETIAHVRASFPDAAKPGFAQTRFVGREKEMERLDRVLDDVLKSHGKFVLVTGEAGVGKTRLVEELKAGAFLEGFRFLRGACYEKEGLFYQPFVEVIGQYNNAVGKYDSEWEEKVFGPYGRELARLVPALQQRSFVQRLPTAPALPDEEEKLRRFDAVTRFLINVSRIEPLLLLFDDLHWADELSRELIHYLVRNIEGERVFVIGTYRVEEMVQRGRRRHPLEEVLTSMDKERRIAERVELQRLDPTQTEEMLAGILGSDTIPEALIAFVYAKTGGNPFMVEEYLRTLTESGSVRVTAAGVQAKGLEAVDLPASVGDLIERRLATLAEGAREAATVAAVIGVQFEFDVLLRVVEDEEELLLDILDEMLRLKLVGETEGLGEEMYEFTHPMIREVLYSGLNRRKRKRLHKRVAQAVEARAKAAGVPIEDSAAVESLAYHFRQAEEPALALPHEVAAGHKAFRAYANEAAIRHYEAALEALKDDLSIEGVRKKRDLLANLVESLDRKGRWEDALRMGETLVHASQALDEPERVAEAYRRRGQILHRMGRFDPAMTEYDRALRALSGRAESLESMRILRELGKVYFFTNEMGLAGKLCSRALAIGEALGAAGELGQLHNLLGNIHRMKGATADAVAAYEKAYEVFHKAGDHRGLLSVLNNLGAIWEANFDLERGLDYKRKGLELAKRIGDVSFTGWLTMAIAVSQTQSGAWDEAEEYLTQAEGIATRIGDQRNLLRIHFNRGRLQYLRGDLRAAMVFMEKSRNLAVEVADYAMDASARIYFANIYRRMGKLGTALACAMEVERAARAQGGEVALMEAVATQAEVHRDMGNLDVARSCIDEALGMSAQLQRRFAHAENNMILGTIEREMQRYPEAEQALARAEQMFREIKSPYEIAVASFELGVSLLRAGGRDRATEAARRLQDALGVFQKLGAQIEVQRAKRELARLLPAAVGVTDSAESLLQAPAFVGRAKELETLEQTLHHAVQQREGRFVLVTGEAGIGKSKLLEEFARRASGRGIPALQGSFRREANESSFQPFVPLLRDCLAQLETLESRAEVQTKLGAILSVILRFQPEWVQNETFQGIAPAFPLSPNEDRFRLFDAMLRLITATAAHRGALLLLDDLHYADEASMGLLHFLVRNLRDQPVAVLAAVNAQERRADGGPFVAVKQELTRERLIQTLDLGPIPFPLVDPFVHGMLGTDQECGRLLEMIWEKSEGNPLFIRELVRTLVQSGLLSRPDVRQPWKIADEVFGMGLPRSLTDLIVGRFAHVVPAGMRVLELASALGREFEFELLLEAVRLLEEPEVAEDEDGLLDLLDDLIRQQILEEAPTRIRKRDTYRFVQGKFQEVIYDRLSPEARRKVHAAAGRALERTYLKEVEAISGELAHHFTRAKEPARAVKYARVAGQRAQALYSNSDAIRYYESALEMIAAQPTLAPMEDRIDILGRLADVYSHTGQTEEAVGRLQRAIDLLRGEGNPELQAGLYLKLSRCKEDRGLFDEAIGHYEDALRMLEGRGDTVIAAKAYLAMGWIQYLRRDLPKAAAYTDSARQITDRLGDKALTMTMLNSLGIIATDMGRSEEALAHFERAEKIAADLGDKVRIAVVANNQARVHLEFLGDPLKAHALFERALQLNEEIGNFQALAGLHNNVGRSWLELGEWDRAKEHMMKSLELASRLSNPRWTYIAHVGLGNLFLFRGDLTSAGVHLERALRMIERYQLHEGRPWVLLFLAQLQQRLGKMQDAEDYFRRALAAARESPAAGDLVRAHDAFAQFHLRNHRLEEAVHHLDEVEKTSARAPNSSIEGSLLRTHGMLADLAGRPEEAQSLLERSVAVFERLHHPYEAARSKLELGIVLNARGAGRGNPLLAAALETFTRLGARFDVERARTALQKTSPPTEPGSARTGVQGPRG